MSKSDTRIEKESIPFVPTHDLSNIKTLEIKFTLPGSSFKTQLPIFREGTLEEVLNFLCKVSQAKSKLGYTSHQKLESVFEQLLQGNAQNKSNTIKNTLQISVQIVVVFNERVDAFKKIYIPAPAAVNNQKNYLQRVWKNDKFTVSKFLDWLKYINMLLAQFPGATDSDCFPPNKVKNYSISPRHSDGGLTSLILAKTCKAQVWIL